MAACVRCTVTCCIPYSFFAPGLHLRASRASEHSRRHDAASPARNAVVEWIPVLQAIWQSNDDPSALTSLWNYILMVRVDRRGSNEGLKKANDTRWRGYSNSSSDRFQIGRRRV